MKKLIKYFIVFLSLSIPQFAHAGFLDKLNEATKKLENASQRMNQTSEQMENSAQQAQSQGTAKKFEKTKTTNPITGDWGNQVTCVGNSATCANGMDDIVNCMHQAKGYYYRLVAAKLEEKRSIKDLTDDERQELEADISSVKDAITTDRVVDPDPADPQRWLQKLTKDDQKQINGLNSKYSKEVREDCDARFGGMSRYSSGR
jgi:hypothetical protein